MAWTLQHADLVAARDEAAADAQEYGGNTAYQRLGRAHLWLDEHEPARRAFRTAAEHIETAVFGRGRGQSSSTWANYGHLLRRAGDADAARDAYRRALELADERRDAAREAELRYLLGEEPGQAEGLFPETLRVLASGDVERAREAVVRAIRAERVAPDYTAPDLTLYDLLEETFRGEGPDHRTMLERAGLLSAGPREPAPAVEPPPVGRWTVGGAVLEQGEEGPIVARLGDRLCIEFVESFGEYEVRLYRGEMQVNVSGMHPTFGEAIAAAADALRANAAERAVDTLRALLAQYGQPH